MPGPAAVLEGAVPCLLRLAGQGPAEGDLAGLALTVSEEVRPGIQARGLEHTTQLTRVSHHTSS